MRSHDRAVIRDRAGRASAATACAGRGEARAQSTIGDMASDVALRPEPRRPAPARPPLPRRGGPRGPLGDYFGRRPVILTLVYYRCPLLCNQVLNGLTRSLKPLSLDAGKDFDVVAVSIDPDETPELAGAEEGGLPGALRPARGRAGWHFLTGDEASIDALAKAVGFQLRLQPADQAVRPRRGHRRR